MCGKFDNILCGDYKHCKTYILNADVSQAM